MKSLYLLALICVFSLELCTITYAQDDYPIIGNEEWNEECELENWENEECSWEEEEAYWDLSLDTDTDTDATGTAGKQSCANPYTVATGDICWNIAQSQQTTVDDMIAQNPGLDCNALQVGQQICIGGGGATPTPPTPTPPTPDNGGDTPTPPAPSGSISVSFEQFSQALTSNQYGAPTQDQYNKFMKYYPIGDISSQREFAMALSQIIWESGGFQFKEEIKCKDTGCPGEYVSPTDDPNIHYYGRGYIQLTWSENYKGASEFLFQDDRLVTNPGMVASDDDIAWQATFWYWKAKVHIAPGVQEGQFGASTAAINGKLECPCTGNCPKRNDIYAKVLPALGLNEQPNTGGC